MRTCTLQLYENPPQTGIPDPDCADMPWWQGQFGDLLRASLGAAGPATPSPNPGPNPDRRPRAAARQVRASLSWHSLFRCPTMAGTHLDI